MRVARRLVISGFVQGVGFRYFAQNAAVREGVTGWVQNLPDGRVEAYVEGEDASVERVERALRRGPSRARVEHVQVSTEDAGGALKGFSIR
jgi:acylphosphatase